MSTMTSNLYPPLVEDTLPSFNLNAQEYKLYFSVPVYTFLEDIKTIHISLINQKTNASILNAETYPFGIAVKNFYKLENDINKQFNYYIILNKSDLIENGFQLNQFYKMQLRFSLNSAIPDKITYQWLEKQKQYCSEWSKVCLIKGISQPKITITGFQENAEEENNSEIIFTNSLSQISGKLSFEDAQEKEYLKSYNITILEDENERIVSKSGDIFTNYYDLNEFYYQINYNLEEGKKYALIFTYTTSNGYQDTIKYLFNIVSTSGDSLEATIDIKEDEQNGRILINIQSYPTSKDFVGNITIRRTSSESNFTKWEDIHTFFYTNKGKLNYQWYDNTIESGIWYTYCIQSRNSLGNRGKIIYPKDQKDNWKKIICIFDDIFLTKKDSQLKIKFNPSLNEFKYNVTESQAVTIGSKYPFIRRNGANYFRTFPIGGLISSLIDMSNWYDPHFDTIYNTIQVSNKDNALLSTAKVGSAKIGIEEDTISTIMGTHNHGDNYFHPELFHSERNELKLLTSKDEIYNKDFVYGSKDKTISQYYEEYNTEHNINEYNDYIYERKFREQVYNFLYENDVKLFRSTTQGNILIKLMNIDFQPVESLGRMLYSFTATAVEIDECSISNYDKYNIQIIGDYEQNLYSTNDIFGQIMISQNDAYTGNILNLIQNKYQKTILDNFLTSVQKLNYLKLEISSDPYLIVDNGGEIKKVQSKDEITETSVLYNGYIVEIGGEQKNSKIIITPKMERQYNHKQHKIEIIHLGFFELKGQNIAITNLRFPYPTTAIIDYQAIIKYTENTSTLAKTIYHNKNIGQLYNIFQPKETIITKIYNKYFYNYKRWYQRLLYINELDLQGDFNTVCYIQGQNDNSFNRILLTSGFFQFKDNPEMLDPNSLKTFPNLYFYGKHFTNSNIIIGSFTFNNNLYDDFPEMPSENTIYNIKKSSLIFNSQNIIDNVLIVNQDHIVDNNSTIILDYEQFYYKVLYYRGNWIVYKNQQNIYVDSLLTGDINLIHDNEYVDLTENNIYQNINDIVKPVPNGLYKITTPKEEDITLIEQDDPIIENNIQVYRYLYYKNNWYYFNKYNDICCPVEVIINYTYETLKGVY